MLAQVDFRIRPAEIVTVVGPNGSGKSSLIRALLGHMPLASGAVTRRQGCASAMSRSGFSWTRPFR
ncbi:ATP-binding cassette domain-containing protein [Paracoccus marcusii]|nr:ATP-binding cassette domain-containing protein [Paracoccus marcusii]